MLPPESLHKLKKSRSSLPLEKGDPYGSPPTPIYPKLPLKLLPSTNDETPKPPAKGVVSPLVPEKSVVPPLPVLAKRCLVPPALLTVNLVLCVATRGGVKVVEVVLSTPFTLRPLARAKPKAREVLKLCGDLTFVPSRSSMELSVNLTTPRVEPGPSPGRPLASSPRRQQTHGR